MRPRHFPAVAKGAADPRSLSAFFFSLSLAEYSTHALDWLLASLTEDNDEVVILRVIEPGSSTHAAWKSGERGMEGARDEAEKVLEQVMEKNGEEKQVSWKIWFGERMEMR